MSKKKQVDAEVVSKQHDEPIGPPAPVPIGAIDGIDAGMVGQGPPSSEAGAVRRSLSQTLNPSLSDVEADYRQKARGGLVTKGVQHQSTFDFGTALRILKRGGAVQRDGWNGKGMKVVAQFPDENSKMSLPYLYLETPNERPHSYMRVPWLASQTDIMAEDWRTYS